MRGSEMKLELQEKFVISINYILPQKPPDSTEYQLSFDLNMGNTESGNNILFAEFYCSLFGEKSDLKFDFKYIFFFKHDLISISNNKELANNLYMICIPYISEFANYIISKTPFPPLHISDIGLPIK
jgi:hypothetical protein